MGLSYVGFNATNDPAVNGPLALPVGWQAGDLAIVASLASHAGNENHVPPALEPGWTHMGLWATGADESLAATEWAYVRLGYRILQAGDTDAGEWGAGPMPGLGVVVYRGQHATTPIGTLRARQGVERLDGSGSISIPRLAPRVSGKSWIVALGIQVSAGLNAELVTGMTTRSSDSTHHYRSILAADTNGSFSGVWSGAYVDSPGATGWPWFAFAIEIRVAEVALQRVIARMSSPAAPTPPGVIIRPGVVTLPLVVPAPRVVAREPGSTGSGPHPSNTKPVRIPPPRAGYIRPWYTDFPNTVPIGPPHPNTLAVLSEASNGAWDSSDRALYDWRKTTSEHDSALDIYMHTEQWGQSTRTHVRNPTGIMRVGPDADAGEGSTNGDWVNYGGRPLAQANRRLIMDVSWVVKFPIMRGRKMAQLIWCGPPVGDPGYGEDNLPEGHLDGGPKGNAFHHPESTKISVGVRFENVFPWWTGNALQAWHLYQIRFHAKGANGHATGYVEFWVDGVRVPFGAAHGSPAGHITVGVPPNAMYWSGQIEALLKRDTIPKSDIDEGHVLFDEFAIDIPA